jgi:hypothetical protein
MAEGAGFTLVMFKFIIFCLCSLDRVLDIPFYHYAQKNRHKAYFSVHGGRGGIRTRDGVKPQVFKTCAMNHYATLPCIKV